VATRSANSFGSPNLGAGQHADGLNHAAGGVARVSMKKNRKRDVPCVESLSSFEAMTA
jgi:hypothetical protein